MAIEIGSEFHKIEKESGNGISYPVSGFLVFSGRTAIETVLKEIPNAKKALLPSYCCNSMIEPFRKAGISVAFYSVSYDNKLIVELDIPKDIDIFLWCNYFGFKTEMPYMGSFLNHGGVIIEDITHSFFSDQPYHHQSSYLIASLRKWEPIYCGGYCAAVNGVLHCVPTESPSLAFIETKKGAMQLKSEYFIDLDEEKKREFLLMYRESNRWLSENYYGLCIDPWSCEYLATIDMEKQKTIRRQNAKVLYKNLDYSFFLFAESDIDCPLYVPLLLPNRDEVRRILIDNHIYCPVHWPKPEGCESNLYDIELSLICDQRYSKKDMERMVSVLKPLL